MSGNLGGDIDKLERRHLLAAGVSLPLLSGCLGILGTADDDQDDGQGDDIEPGEPIETLEVVTYTRRQWGDVTREIISQWGDLGLDFNIEQFDFDHVLNLVYVEHDYDDLAYSVWAASPERIDPDFYLSTFTTESPLNVTGYSNEDYDELYSKQRQEFDTDQRSEYIGEMQEILFDDLPSIAVTWPHYDSVYNSELWDIEPTDFLGVSTNGAMSIIEAEPRTENQRLVVAEEDEALAVANPLAPIGVNVQFYYKLIYDTPVRFGKEGEFINWAVESLERIDDTTFDLTLRENMTFHDGVDVTGEDLEFTFEFLNTYDFPKFAPFVGTLDGATLETDLTVRIDLTEPDAPWIDNALLFMNLLPKHIWESVPEEVDEPVNWEADADDIVGSGPFVLESMSSEELHLTTFQEHWAAPAYDELIITNVPSTEAIRSGFVDGDIHATPSPPRRSVVEELMQEDHLSVAESPGLEMDKISFQLRTDEGPYQDRQFRKALLEATDAQMIVDIFYQGAADMGDGTIIHPEGIYGKDDLPKVGAADIEEAENILRDAGYTWDDDGRLCYPAE